jgi:hypothetical protein
MQRLFWNSLVCVGLILVASVRQADASLTIVHIPSDEDFAASVFVGPDSKMPMASRRYYVSINPTRGPDGGIVAPESLISALTELRRALPRWYLNALVRSNGQSECSVIISESEHSYVNVTTYVEDWYWINWQMHNPATGLRRDLARLNLHEEAAIRPALSAGFCEYVKGADIEHVLNIVEKYGKLKDR